MDQDFETQSALAAELGAGERLLWSGRPRQGLYLRASDALVIPFSLMWGGFAIFWEFMATQPLRHPRGGAAPLAFFVVFPLFGLPFVAIGLYMILGRFFVDMKLRQKTAYAVTDQRIIIRSGLFQTDVKSLSLRALADVTLTEERDGRGTITFGPALPFAGAYGNAWPGTRRYAPPAFESVEDARRVYGIVRAAQAGAAPPAGGR